MFSIILNISLAIVYKFYILKLMMQRFTSKKIYVGLLLVCVSFIFLAVVKFIVYADTTSHATGCVSTNAGLLYSLKLGDTPLYPCPTGDAEIKIGNVNERYQANANGITSITPSATWIDVPGASITKTFIGGEWKATYTGSVVMTQGDGTAYVRFQIRPTGGSSTDSNSITLYRSGTGSPTSENYSNSFTLQSLLSIPSGEVTIVPQIYSNNTNWSLLDDSVLIIEK